MRKNLIVGMAAVVLFSCWAAEPLMAQSTLEYAGLISATTAAAAKKTKDQGDEAGQEGASGTDMVTGSMKGMYGQGAAALSKGSVLLGQVGGGMPSVPASPSPAAAQDPAGSSGGGPAPEQEPAPQDPGVAPQGGVESATIHLKGGQTVTGQPLEHTKELLKILCEGVELTYYTDEIESVELRSP